MVEKDAAEEERRARNAQLDAIIAPKLENGRAALAHAWLTYDELTRRGWWRPGADRPAPRPAPARPTFGQVLGEMEATDPGFGRLAVGLRVELATHRLAYRAQAADRAVAQSISDEEARIEREKARPGTRPPRDVLEHEMRRRRVLEAGQLIDPAIWGLVRRLDRVIDARRIGQLTDGDQHGPALAWRVARGDADPLAGYPGVEFVADVAGLVAGLAARRRRAGKILKKQALPALAADQVAELVGRWRSDLARISRQPAQERPAMRDSAAACLHRDVARALWLATDNHEYLWCPEKMMRSIVSRALAGRLGWFEGPGPAQVDRPMPAVRETHAARLDVLRPVGLGLDLLLPEPRERTEEVGAVPALRGLPAQVSRAAGLWPRRWGLFYGYQAITADKHLLRMIDCINSLGDERQAGGKKRLADTLTTGTISAGYSAVDLDHGQRIADLGRALDAVAKVGEKWGLEMVWSAIEGPLRREPSGQLKQHLHAHLAFLRRRWLSDEEYAECLRDLKEVAPRGYFEFDKIVRNLREFTKYITKGIIPKGDGGDGRGFRPVDVEDMTEIEMLLYSVAWRRRNRFRYYGRFKQLNRELGEGVEVEAIDPVTGEAVMQRQRMKLVKEGHREIKVRDRDGNEKVDRIPVVRRQETWSRPARDKDRSKVRGAPKDFVLGDCIVIHQMTESDAAALLQRHGKAVQAGACYVVPAFRTLAMSDSVRNLGVDELQRAAAMVSETTAQRIARLTEVSEYAFWRRVAGAGLPAIGMQPALGLPAGQNKDLGHNAVNCTGGVSASPAAPRPPPGYHVIPFPGRTAA